MPRNLSPAVLAALAAPQKSLGLFLELNFQNANTPGSVPLYSIVSVQTITSSGGPGITLHTLYVVVAGVLTLAQEQQLYLAPSISFQGLTAATWLNGITFAYGLVGVGFIAGPGANTTITFLLGSFPGIPANYSSTADTGQLLAQGIAVGSSGTTTTPAVTANNINGQAPGGWPAVGWKPVCTLPLCDPGGTGIPTATSQANGASPNLDGQAMSFSLTGPALSPGFTTNALWAYIAGADDAATYFNADFQLYISSASWALAQAFEIDMFKFSTTDNVNYMMGTQYDKVSGHWQVWDSNLGWVSSAVTAPPVAGGWNHIQQQAHTVAGDRTHIYFDYIVIGGVTYWYSGTVGTPMAQASGPLPAGWSSVVGIQFQIDVASAGGTVSMNLDEASFVASITSAPAAPAVAPAAPATPPGALALWSGVGPMSSPGPAWDPGATFPYGQIFTGMGWMGRIESVPQNSELTAENMTLQLSGIPVDLLGDVVNTVRLGGTAALWLGFFSPTGQLLADPLALWNGALDVPTVTDGADTCTVTITVENSLLALNLSSNRRFTTLDQQLDFPGDTGFDYVSAMQDLFLPFPCGIISAHTIQGNTGDAPDVSNALTLSPPGPLKLVLGGGSSTQQMAASAYFISGPYQFTSQKVVSAGLWSSSDTGVAIVNNGQGANAQSGSGNWGTGGGLITATGPGNCTITFFFGTVSCSITVTVLPAGS